MKTMITEKVRAILQDALIKQETAIQRIELEVRELSEKAAMLESHLHEMRKCREEIKQVLAE